jgi:hypothetical protein
MGRARRLAAGASLLATAGGFAWLALERSWMDWRSLAFGAGLAVASIGLTRKNVFAQVMSRGLAWIVFAPSAVVIAVELMKGRLMEPAMTAFGVTSGLALFLARPMLDTDEARAQFAPTKFRRSFLAACTAAVTIGLVTGMVAWEMLWHGMLLGGIGLAALGTSMLASSLGVLRMRGWGIALATLNAIVSLVVGAVVGDAQGFAIAATALPGALFLLPIALAKLGVGEDASARATSHVRIAEEAPLPTRVRVHVSDADLGLDDEVVRSDSSCESSSEPSLRASCSQPARV